MKNNRKGRVCVFVSVAVISTLLLTCFLPQNTAGKELLSKWENSSGVSENTTVYRYADPGGPSIEFYTNNSFIDTPKPTPGTGSGKFQFDADILINEDLNTLNIGWCTLDNSSKGFFVTISGNTTVHVGIINWDTMDEGEETFFNVIDPDFKLNTWTHIRIIKKADNATYKIIVGSDTFTHTFTAFGFTGYDFGGFKEIMAGNVGNSSVFVDNIQIQYTPTYIDIAAGWYDTIVGSEYFPIALLLIFGVIVIAVVKGMVIR